MTKTKTTKFVNEYDYTIDGVREIAGTYNRRRCTKIIVVTMLIMVVLFVMVNVVSGKLVISRLVTHILILLLVLAVLVVESWLVCRRAVRLQVEQAEMLFKGKVPHIRIELTDDGISIQSSIRPDSHEKYPLSTIKKVFQTDNYLVLVLKGPLFAAMDKHGFGETDWHDVLAYLNDVKSTSAGRQS